MNTLHNTFMAALVVFAGQAMASGDSHVYGGVEITATQFSGDGPKDSSIFKAGQDFSDNDAGYGVHLGYQFNDWFSVELGYTDFGRGRDTYALKDGVVFIVAPNDTQTTDAKGVSLAGVFGHAITDDFSVFALLGVSSLRYETTFSGGFSETSGSLQAHHTYTDQGLLFGIGAKYAIADSLNLRTDIRRNDVGDFKLDTLSIGLEYTF